MTKPEDPEVRALIGELMAAAPTAPPLPEGPVVRSVRRARRVAVAAVAFASLVAIVSGVAWATRSRNDSGQVRIAPQPTALSPTTTRPTRSTATTGPGKSTPTTAVAAPDPLPAGSALIGLDAGTGRVDALDDNGDSLRTLFNVGVETTHHWPTISQLQLTPDGTTLWYAANPTAIAPCSTITQRNLSTGETRGRYQGSWMALSPDGTRLAYAGCFDQDPTVYIVDVAHEDVWKARAPKTKSPVTALGYLTWTPDGTSVVAEYLDDAAQWHLSKLTPSGPPGAIPWGPTVLTFAEENRLATTPNALLVSNGAAGSTWSIDSYDWSYRRVSSAPTNLGPLDLAVSLGLTYAAGGPFTGGSGTTPSLYRLQSNGQLSTLRAGIAEIVAVPPGAPARAPLTRGVAACTTAQLHFALDRALQSVMQQPGAFFGLRNTSSASCTLDGYPDAFELLDGSGQQIPLANADDGSYQINDPGPRVVTLAPGAVAFFGFGWSASVQPNGTQVGCVHAATARVRIPGSQSFLTAPTSLGTPVCPPGGLLTAIAERAAFTIGTP